MGGAKSAKGGGRGREEGHFLELTPLIWIGFDISGRQDGGRVGISADVENFALTMWVPRGLWRKASGGS